MKQFFLALCLTAGTVAAANAQAPAPNAANGQRLEEYCQVTARPKLNGRYVIAIDYGQRQKLISENLFRDATGKSVEFNSAMDALNWLSAQGWELASTFVLVEDNSSVAYYVLRRRPA
ncbi:hypothetical protein I2I05_14695 [Hymenobacter sp. BT683]|uniref:DUF4177 domain-containing protein n=1 Tax=Hymenobacter jeongseonensis TaxID=2791027 RepID=A0ABS0IJV1_9BACT|nr:hypothetical protein [Hymenobacter jeongseonensis]MBF9238650.1 hypothetical protein [Hymenobacter jeongseonensis]